MVALGDEIFATGANEEGSGSFGELGRFKEGFEVSEWIGRLLAVGWETAVIDCELVVDNIGKIIVVIIAAEGDEDVGVVGDGSEGGAIRFAVAISTDGAGGLVIGSRGGSKIE